MLELHSTALGKDGESSPYHRVKAAEELDHPAFRRHHAHLDRGAVRVGGQGHSCRSLGINAGLSKLPPQLLPSGAWLGPHQRRQSPQFIEIRSVERALRSSVGRHSLMVYSCIRLRDTDVSAIWLSANLLGSRLGIRHGLKSCLLDPVPGDLLCKTQIVSPNGHGVDRAVGMSKRNPVPPAHRQEDHLRRFLPTLESYSRFPIRRRLPVLGGDGSTSHSRGRTIAQ